MTQRDHEIETLFDIAVGLDTNARARFLDRECAYDEELRQELNGLLAHADCPTPANLKHLGRFVESAGLSPAAAEAPQSPPWLVPGASMYQYGFIRELGRGGMGTVFLAQDTKLDRKVAIKIVRSSVNGPAHADELLLQEAKTMAQLSHPNVVQVFEVGSFQGRVYIAMEYVCGTTLRQWLDSIASLRPPVRQREVLRQFIAAGRGLEAAHETGLAHCDFKPDNVLVGDNGRPRVGDFGQARLIATATRPAHGERGRDWGQVADVASTATTMVARNRKVSVARDAHRSPSGCEIVGTPRYMAPEQWRGEIADSRSDQFSFCVALYEALYGQPPFASDCQRDLRASVVACELAEPARGAAVSRPVRKALERGLAHNPTHRFPDMGALLHALEEWPRRRKRRVLLGVAAIAAAAIGAAHCAIPEPHGVCGDTGGNALWHAQH